MAYEGGGSQVTTPLETVPGIASVLRSPVADALVGLIRAGAGIEAFQWEYANELVLYAVRRGLIGPDEGERLLEESREAKSVRRARPPKPQPAKSPRQKAAKKPARRVVARKVKAKRR